jgi:hypothetical protein
MPRAQRIRRNALFGGQLAVRTGIFIHAFTANAAKNLFAATVDEYSCTVIPSMPDMHRDAG